MKRVQDRVVVLLLMVAIQVTDHSEASILGPGFLSCLPPGVTLVPGQHVYITHNGREVEGQVRSHHTQQVSNTNTSIWNTNTSNTSSIRLTCKEIEKKILFLYSII